MYIHIYVMADMQDHGGPYLYLYLYICVCVYLCMSQQTCKTMAVRIHESISVSACPTVCSYVSTSFPSLTSQSLCLSIALIFSPHVLHVQHTCR